MSQEKEKPVLIAKHEGLIDLVEFESEVRFLFTEMGVPVTVSALEVGGRTAVPPPINQIPWLLPRAIEIRLCSEKVKAKGETESDAELFDNLMVYHKAISELPSEAHYVLLAAFDIHTYLLESFQYSPILSFFAVPERGKSRTGKGIVNVAYRGVTVESLRDPYILRMAEDFGASLFFDVRDIWKKAESCGSEDILLHRFERGGIVPRVLWPEKGPHRDTRYYRVFGPTIIGSNVALNHILETRTIPINMPDTERRFEQPVTPAVGLPLKESLVEFRSRHYGCSLPDVNKPASGRLGDILKPLLQVVRLVAPQREASFMSLVRQLEGNRRVEKAQSLEAQIINAVHLLSDQVFNGILSNKAITDALNEGKPERERLSYRLIGHRLKALGFEPADTRTGAAAILFDRRRLDRLKVSYGLSITSAPSASPEPPYPSRPLTDDPDVADVHIQERST